MTRMLPRAQARRHLRLAAYRAVIATKDRELATLHAADVEAVALRQLLTDAEQERDALRAQLNALCAAADRFHYTIAMDRCMDGRITSEQTGAGALLMRLIRAVKEGDTDAETPTHR